MTMIRVTSLKGTLGREEREQLGEKLTNAVLEVETGKDTPEARAGVMVQFEELPNGHWFHGGRAADELYQRNGLFSVTATVMTTDSLERVVPIASIRFCNASIRTPIFSRESRISESAKPDASAPARVASRLSDVSCSRRTRTLSSRLRRA